MMAKQWVQVGSLVVIHKAASFIKYKTIEPNFIIVS